jgi:hypothetical protein
MTGAVYRTRVTTATVERYCPGKAHEVTNLTIDPAGVPDRSHSSLAPSAAQDAAKEFLARHGVKVRAGEFCTLHVDVEVGREMPNGTVRYSGVYACVFHLGLTTTRKPWRRDA